MGRMKELAIDQMNNEPCYEVYMMQADGPDDFCWEPYEQYTSLSEATKALVALEEQGYGVKLFDPHMGKFYDSKGNEVKA